MATLVTATCGNDVVGWSPDGASAQQRVFELQHRARVSGTGWLPKGKALAVAGNDCVVNIFSMPDKKVAATVPKTISLPTDPPAITALALSQATVLYGCSDGSINMAKLPDVKVNCLHPEDGHPIADLVVTPQNKLLAAASQNGHVLLMPFERSAAWTPKYLSCKDRDARCSLAVSSVGERIACGSQKGGIHIWDAVSAAALHFVQDGDRAVSIAFQAHSQDTFFSASASKMLSLWDCRTLKKTTQVDLVKPASSIAAGMTPHDVAVGDGVGVAWLYDMRRPETPRLRLPCGTSHAVKSIQWVPRPSSLDSRSHVNRKAGISSSASQGVVHSVAHSTDSNQLDADAMKALAADPSGLVSALPRAPPAMRDHHRGGIIAPRLLSQTLPTSPTLPVVYRKEQEQGMPHVGADESVSAAAPAAPEAAIASSQHIHLGRDEKTNPTCEREAAPSMLQEKSGRVQSKLPETLSGNLQPDQADHREMLPTFNGTHENVERLSRVTEAAVKRVMDTNLAQLQMHLEGIESRMLSRILSRDTAEAPAYHTQRINEHVDKATASIKKEIQTWLSEYQEETLKQFHLAQQDLMDVATALSHQMSSLTASVEQLQARITSDEENRRKVAQFM